MARLKLPFLPFSLRLVVAESPQVDWPSQCTALIRARRSIPARRYRRLGNSKNCRPRTLAALALSPEIGFGEGYSEGRIEVQGDLVRFLDAVLESIRDANAIGWHSKLISRWLDLAQANSLRGSARNIHHHYDLTADFYKLWLDPQLVYTCAYFPEPFSTLEQAQVAKMDHVCRKVWLQPGERVVEAGCGWGALALHMAKHYGVRVRAFNISKEQILIARERAKQEGLEHQVEFIEDDYRNISGRYDAFVSVGMLEHIGTQNYENLGQVIHRTIGDAGRGILHFIGRNFPHSFSPWIRKRIFPGACAPSLAQAMAVLQPCNFSVLDVENLRTTTSGLSSGSTGSSALGTMS